ncbi:uncharacterized protein [Physcomitrium patens]|uniref:Uncharacterized protein n=1 Tax=Physcomitrium patens TaxID=3218 RepID=A0A2K1IHP9_PHYPA|nr:uncharacterized protein LOC112275665 [Physcomitrium patens]XP_024361990.1 uncharacterized protein LOC112275665 [Physcomitrium patens]PNR28806.1 hypothetical protein PHYPA_027498 [Physcomitrium patens]|eukprot:XP_024361989.1 uncharacterized protein LOC112275665 [Physcomitrella patens]
MAMLKAFRLAPAKTSIDGLIQHYHSDSHQSEVVVVSTGRRWQKIKTVKTSLAIVNRWRKTLEAGHSNKTVTVVLAATVNTSKANPTLNVIEIAGDTAIKSGRPNQKNRSFQRQLQPNEVQPQAITIKSAHQNGQSKNLIPCLQDGAIVLVVYAILAGEKVPPKHATIVICVAAILCALGKHRKVCKPSGAIRWQVRNHTPLNTESLLLGVIGPALFGSVQAEGSAENSSSNSEHANFGRDYDTLKIAATLAAIGLCLWFKLNGQNAAQQVAAQQAPPAPQVAQQQAPPPQIPPQQQVAAQQAPPAPQVAQQQAPPPQIPPQQQVAPPQQVPPLEPVDIDEILGRDLEPFKKNDDRLEIHPCINHEGEHQG